MMNPPAPDAEGKAADGGALHTVPPAQFPVNSLAWLQNADHGFLTVNVCHVDIHSKRAFVEEHPECARSVAAAEAAAEVVRKATTGFLATDIAAVNLSEGQECTGGQHGNPSPLVSPQRSDTGSYEHQGEQCILDSANPAHEPTYSSKLSDGGPEPSEWPPVQDGADPSTTGSPAGDKCILQQFSHENVSSFFTCLTSAASIEHQAADAAANAAAEVCANFISQASFEVPISHLWPYSAPPLPPHPMPDDSACCDTLSAAALLQLLQHRYLRDEIYTYAANVLLAVNPYKPLPHLYSAQHISLYRHWREVARIYRRPRNEDRSACTGKDVYRADSTTTIHSILESLPGVLPVHERSSLNADGFYGRTDSTGLNPWITNIKGYSDGIPAASEPRHAASSLKQAFIESTANRNRPPPHPFVVAEEALRRLVGTQTSQTIVVSGQSGAGKTETSKQLMLFLTHASTSPNETLKGIAGGAAGLQVDSEVPMTISGQRTEVAALLGGVQTLQEATELQKRIVSCNAIFESFGNAATRRNHNSSRIGRLTLLHFDSGGLLRGGGLRTYLLEAARITAHKKGDRNFHVFYQLLRGSTEELRMSMNLNNDEMAYRMLRPADSHNFLQRLFSKGDNPDNMSAVDDAGGNAKVPLEVDQDNFELMVKGLKLAEFSAAEINDLLQLLAGLLHLSNVSLTEGDGDILQLQDIPSHEALKNASLLLGLEEEKLEVLLQCRCMLLKGDILLTHRNEQQSSSARCSLIKFIYSRLFDYIVHRLNESVARHLETRGQEQTEAIKGSKTIGILDIYGFESFGLENGLEQLCINYANERQQQLFVQQVIEEEVALYAREGITTPAVTAKSKRVHRRQSTEQEGEQQLSGDGTKHGSFKAELELSLLSSLPDTSALLQDLQEGVFRRLDDSCRLLAQGQPRDDTHFWNGLFTYWLVGAQQLQARKGGGGLKRISSVAGKVQERVFAVKHFAGTVLYGTEGWLDLNNDRIENELERLVANSTKSLLRQAMQQHEENQKQEGMCVSAAGGGQFSSITKRFLKSVKDLNQELQGPHMNLHFIRCFIPNCQMKPGNFERKTVLHQEQEIKVQALLDQATVTDSIGEDLISTGEERRMQCRILDKLRHWNAGSARDRTLVSATLGLLPQCRPGSFICGVSLVCFKAPVYGEAAALMADPGQFFKTPEDVCRLITAIQRLRWRVAVRIVLHIHPTLVWLQRRAYLMRKIKEAITSAAAKIILLRRHILSPLRARVMRRLSLRHGIRLLDQMVLNHFKRVWRSFKKALAAASATEAEGGVWRPEAADQTTNTRKALPGLRSHVQSDEFAAAFAVHGHPHAGIHPWNSRIFPITKYHVQGPMQCHHVAVHLGNKLYGVDVSAAVASKGVDSGFGVPKKQPASDVHILPAVPLIEQHLTHKLTGLPSLQVESSGESPQTVGSSGQTRVVRIARHPLYTGLFLAVDSAANLLVAAAECDLGPRIGQGSVQRVPPSPGSTPFGEPSTCLPVLDSRPRGVSQFAVHQSDMQCSGPALHASMYHPAATSFNNDYLPKHLFEEPMNEAEAFPPMQLIHIPVPPNKWLPRDLLHQVTQTPGHNGIYAACVHPPTVRPLSISFAHPQRTDCAIVLCLVQARNKKSNSNGNTIGKLIAVLVDLLRREPINWIPLLFASHDISTCARRNSAFLQQLSEASISSHAEYSSSAAKEYLPPGYQRPTTRSRSTMLSTIRLHPLWGNLWAVIGPSLLAVFSVNLRFLHHPPAEVENQRFTRDPPLRLLWNMPSIPRVSGMTFELADVWLTGCTYTRLAPAHLSSLAGMDPVIQVLQMMPFGEVTRSVEAKMQRLLLLSTADNSVLLLQWSERTGDPITASGTLVLLDQVRLPSPVLQFLRHEPEIPFKEAYQGNHSQDHACRLLRAFPWEGDLLVPKSTTDDEQSIGFDSSDSTSASSGNSKPWSSRVEGRRLLRSAHNKAKGKNAGSLVRDFPYYGIAIVLAKGQGIMHTLDDQALQRRAQNTSLHESELLAVATSPAFSGLLVSLRRFHDGFLRLCLEDNQGNFHFVGQLDLQDPSRRESRLPRSRVPLGSP
ncbi:Myosin IJ heavy chain, putative [Eimeria brunetti]|uniref:Myosin IJ heavy chain, putative n=1 Tax=Eimeria brunetti TaxID=51314 RepID=U6LKB7_9EIME|nr:Myosin IJ heavy chain, putative [Eimeria brunetti]